MKPLHMTALVFALVTLAGAAGAQTSPPAGPAGQEPPAEPTPQQSNADAQSDGHDDTSSISA